MISVEAAKQQILTAFKPLESVMVPLEAALGRTLSQTIISDKEFPQFDNSSVDGFAVQANDVITVDNQHPAVLKVVADIPAGNVANVTLAVGQAARIMTGAPIPDGADAVVMVEDTDAGQGLVSELPKQVLIFNGVKHGENIRRHATDIQLSQEILQAGAVLRAQDIGILGLLGFTMVPVWRKPKDAILSSGDELVPVGSPLSPGKIHDTNSLMLTALAQNAGCDVIHFGIAADRFDAVEELFNKAADSNPDLIISSAGVSVGAFDFVKAVVESSGVLSIWKVNMRPGKPLAFGSYRNIPFFGLPGNPVSAFVSFLVFITPVLDLLRNDKSTRYLQKKVILSEAIESDGRESYLRAIVRQKNGKLVASLTGHQGSGNLLSLVQANALLIVRSGVKSCPPGSEVDAWLLEKMDG